MPYRHAAQIVARSFWLIIVFVLNVGNLFTSWLSLPVFNAAFLCREINNMSLFVAVVYSIHLLLIG